MLRPTFLMYFQQYKPKSICFQLLNIFLSKKKKILMEVTIHMNEKKKFYTPK